MPKKKEAKETTTLIVLQCIRCGEQVFSLFISNEDKELGDYPTRIIAQCNKCNRRVFLLPTHMGYEGEDPRIQIDNADPKKKDDPTVKEV